MAKEKTEKRYRVLPNVTMWHDLCQCHVEAGEDYKMDAKYPDGRLWRYPDEVQFYLDNHMMEIYFVPVGTPHVVHERGKQEHIDPETGEHSEIMTYSSAAKQWTGETVFIDKYVPTETVKE